MKIFENFALQFGYNDNLPIPATPTKWTYLGMYYVGDKGVGQWSDPVSINVGA